MAPSFQIDLRRAVLREYFRADHEDRLAFCRLVWLAAILVGATFWLGLFRAIF